MGNYAAAERGEPRPPWKTRTMSCCFRPPRADTLLLAGFVLIIAGSSLALVGARRIDLAPAAAGVLLATAAHGFVDVYWVRGTPVLSWLLVGMVCGLFATRRESGTAT